MQDTLQTFIYLALAMGVLLIIQGLRVAARPDAKVLGQALQGCGIGWLVAAAICYTGFGAQTFYISILVPIITGALLGWANGIKVRDRMAKGASR